MAILHSKIEGNGMPLLILHGFMGMGDNWKTLGGRFAEHFEVHLIDQRNHGRSFHSQDFSYELMVEDLKNYMESYELQHVYILGHSMGGKVAMLFATMYPEFVNKMIIADIGPKFYPRHHDSILEGLAAVDFTQQKSRNDIEEVLKRYIPEVGIRQFLLKNVYWKSKDALSYRFNLESFIENLDEIGVALPAMTVFDGPVLFLKGENSGYIAAHDEPLIKAHFPEATIATVKNAGHWLHAENPNDFYSYVVRFLEEN